MDTQLLMIQVAGFVIDGVETVDDQSVIDRHGWTSPEVAVRQWRRRGGVYSTGRYRSFENGRQCVTDVSGDRHYAELGISTIFDRVYFVRVPIVPRSAEPDRADLDRPHRIEEKR
ncbi:putative membrane protein (plasmid) [Clavibacter sepedonicus]|uniref:Membrane protein n=1 Tax=Clavibacter sepedonicus TaxID=31964 RepID=B0RJ83_CLASE|nr:hypothetical protein [Clavibacter sepedonicus]UUK67344.1 hypothetical protein LRE50_16425 [Clavibacter sepedonicus]CAQ03273.1 putative membrane protein [Clavibacter sepedonicus]